MSKKSKFLSWLVDPWTEVSNGSLFPLQLRKLDFVSRPGLKIPSFTPGVPILLIFCRMFLLSGDVQLKMFMLTPTLFHAELITDAFDWFVLSRDKLSRGRSTREFFSTFVTRSFLMPPPMMAGSKSPTPTNNLRTMSTMWVYSIGSLLGSTCMLESLIVSTWSSDS